MVKRLYLPGLVVDVSLFQLTSAAESRDCLADAADSR